jgi:hypothetical protein
VRAAERFPAMTMGKTCLQVASISALWRMQAELPPSVPPTRRKMSGLMASISSMSSLGQLKGIDLGDLGARAEGGLLGGLARQLRHQAAGDHAQSAGGGGAGVAGAVCELPGLLLQLAERAVQPVVDVGLDGGIGGGGAQQLALVCVGGGHLGIGAAEIDQQYGTHRLSPSRRGLS